jgi:hypothetical protein
MSTTGLTQAQKAAEAAQKLERNQQRATEFRQKNTKKI